MKRGHAVTAGDPGGETSGCQRGWELDTALLRFYQRIGFRILHIERDAFTPAAGYPPELRVDSIRLLDRAWLDFTW